MESVQVNGELAFLVKQAQGGAEEAFQQVCLRFAGLVKKYAFQPHLRLISEEAESQGWLAVVQCIRRYDVGCGVQFPAYVESQVKYAVWNLFKRECRRYQWEAELDGGQGEDGVARLERLADGTDIAMEVEVAFVSQELDEAIQALPERQGFVIRRTILEDEGLKAVGMELGITAQGVYNLRQRGLGRLKMLCAGIYRV